MEPTSFDELMGRALDGAARADDWQALEGAVRCEPALAAALVRGLRVERGLEAALVQAGEVAERVELPREAAQLAPRTTARAVPRASTHALRRAAGWIVAAGIALAWGLSAGAGSPATPAQGAPADPAAPIADAVEADPSGTRAARPDLALPQAADPHLEALGELPLRLVSSRPLASGRFEVLYVRPVLERTVVDGALGIAPDESGQPHVVPASFDQPAYPRSF